MIDVGTGQLLHKLSSIGGHRLHKTSLSLRKNNIECQSGFSGTGYPGDHRELPAGQRKAQVLQVILSRADYG